MKSLLQVNRTETDRDSIKAFYKLLVDRLGDESWAERKAAYVHRIREVESRFKIAHPVEAQLFYPPENDIDWYILTSYLAYDFPYSDSTYSTRRVLPYAIAIGSAAQQLRNVKNVNSVIDRMLANNNNPETQLFELLTASLYLKNGYDVSFIPENSIAWPDGKKKSPDLLVKSGEMEFYVECKRAAKQTKYSNDEEQAWQRIWSELSTYLLNVSPWTIVDLTFHEELPRVELKHVINATSLALKSAQRTATDNGITAKVEGIDKLALKKHYKSYSVRPNSPQHELLVFGDTDNNEKRSIATVAAQITRPGTEREILNIFVKGVANCVAAQWRCDHNSSLSLRSKHFKGLVNDGVSQIPPDRPGVVHVWFETRDGVRIEELRSDKNIDNISNYDASGTTVLAALVHGVNYYPREDNYQWAETVQQFTRTQDLSHMFPKQILMLSTNGTTEVSGTSHWMQDKGTRNDRKS